MQRAGAAGARRSKRPARVAAWRPAETHAPPPARAWQVADVCNSLGMQMLQRDDFAACHALLKRAQARAYADPPMTAISLNNLACYHRTPGPSAGRDALAPRAGPDALADRTPCEPRG